MRIFVYRCSKEALNGLDIKGKVILCDGSFGPVELFEDILTNVVSGGASGIIFALYTTDILASNEECEGIPCVLIDLDIGSQITEYISSQRHETIFCDLPNYTVTFSYNLTILMC